jgi:hypothetical protein
VKCGRTVEPAKTRLLFIDGTRQVYARLVHHLGPVWAGLIAGVAFLILLALFVGLIVLRLIHAG